MSVAMHVHTQYAMSHISELIKCAERNQNVSFVRNSNAMRLSAK